ncbi:MAG: hypothetical protein ACFB8W_18970, partial [Elainellaceae cyanobacterium]
GRSPGYLTFDFQRSSTWQSGLSLLIFGEFTLGTCQFNFTGAISGAIYREAGNRCACLNLAI